VIIFKNIGKFLNLEICPNWNLNLEEFFMGIALLKNGGKEFSIKTYVVLFNL
jgi:hypothetical protein